MKKTWKIVEHRRENVAEATRRLRNAGVPRPRKVPLLPKAKLGPPAEGASSARAWEEGTKSSLEGEQPRSAPATTREASGAVNGSRDEGARDER